MHGSDLLFRPLSLPMLAISWLIFFGAAIVSFILQVRAENGSRGLRAFVRHCFPPDIWSSKSSWIDVFMYFGSKLSSRASIAISVALTILESRLVADGLRICFPAHAAMQINLIGLVVWSLLLFLLCDFSNYLSHVLQHRVPALWELHKVHHSAEHLNFATAKRLHPLGEIFDGVLAAMFMGVPVGWLVFAYDLDFARIGILLANANTIGAIVILDILRHGHFRVSYGWFDKILLSPFMHQLHHSSLTHHHDKNFGNKLSVWDWAFGTGYKPEANEKMVFGLTNSEEKEYQSLTGVYVKPILKIAALIRATLVGDRPGFVWRRSVATPAPVDPASALFEARLRRYMPKPSGMECGQEPGVV